MISKEIIKEHLGYLAIIWSVIKWMLVASAVTVGIAVWLMNSPYTFAWTYMLTFVCCLLWTRKFFH